MINLQDPTLQERLRRRAPEGRFEISEIDLVLAIRDVRRRWKYGWVADAVRGAGGAE